MNRTIVVCLLLLSTLGVSAQIEKGAFMIESGIKLGNNWNYESELLPEGFGISFGTRDVFNKNSSTGSDQFNWGNRNFQFSLSPRFGYSIFQNFMIGIDLKYARNNFFNSPFKNENKGYDQGKGYGFFARKYFGSKRFIPFIEAGFGFWSLIYFDYSRSPGGGLYEYTEKKDLAYYGGAVGCSYSIVPRFKMNLAIKLQHTKYTIPNYAYKELDFDSALILSFSYFFKKKTKI